LFTAPTGPTTARRLWVLLCGTATEATAAMPRFCSAFARSPDRPPRARPPPARRPPRTVAAASTAAARSRASIRARSAPPAPRREGSRRRAGWTNPRGCQRLPSGRCRWSGCRRGMHRVRAAIAVAPLALHHALGMGHLRSASKINCSSVASAPRTAAAASTATCAIAGFHPSPVSAARASARRLATSSCWTNPRGCQRLPSGRCRWSGCRRMHRVRLRPRGCRCGLPPEHDSRPRGRRCGLPLDHGPRSRRPRCEGPPRHCGRRRGRRCGLPSDHGPCSPRRRCEGPPRHCSQSWPLRSAAGCDVVPPGGAGGQCDVGSACVSGNARGIDAMSGARRYGGRCDVESARVARRCAGHRCDVGRSATRCRVGSHRGEIPRHRCDVGPRRRAGWAAPRGCDRGVTRRGRRRRCEVAAVLRRLRRRVSRGGHAWVNEAKEESCRASSCALSVARTSSR